jgi:hypothetical protein
MRSTMQWAEIEALDIKISSRRSLKSEQNPDNQAISEKWRNSQSENYYVSKKIMTINSKYHFLFPQILNQIFFLSVLSHIKSEINSLEGQLTSGKKLPYV